MTDIGVTTYKFDDPEKLPHNYDVIEVKNPRNIWVEAQFRLVNPNEWELVFDATDICTMDEAIEYFSEWRPQVIKPMTKERIL